MKCRTPTPSQHPSRPSFDDTQEVLKFLLKETPKNHATAKAKVPYFSTRSIRTQPNLHLLQALMRDGYRCILTGAYDHNIALAMPQLVPPGTTRFTVTEAAHIFPESTNMGISGADEYGHKVLIIQLAVGRDYNV